MYTVSPHLSFDNFFKIVGRGVGAVSPSPFRVFSLPLPSSPFLSLPLPSSPFLSLPLPSSPFLSLLLTLTKRCQNRNPQTIKKKKKCCDPLIFSDRSRNAHKRLFGGKYLDFCHKEKMTTNLTERGHHGFVLVETCQKVCTVCTLQNLLPSLCSAPTLHPPAMLQVFPHSPVQCFFNGRHQKT